ncbi:MULTISPECIES: hypothetical protein [unclassified Streptomyces]|uniref:hypothetical protein n=1 Tax=unclassified Streptomyces TaxID=2593676 RepID=UPI00224FBEF1|nr:MULTISPECIES: hypothetical protein [unclassified Streptomyces]MCX5334051.1 hypothetical protein [Streptomyces sp. NBC_00140]MCX5363555.1 hypothetical protein [Streptomyces sp. NBC_00124]
MTAEHDGIDALMAAITDEPLSEEARGDAVFMAEHRSASADLTLLREQLGVIGQALAEPVPVPAPVPAPAPKPARVGPSRVRLWFPKLALGGLAVAAAASVVAGLGWLIATGGPNAMSSSDDGGSAGAQKSEADADAGTRFGSPHYLACTRLVVEGKVTSVERLVDGVQLRIIVEVSRYYKKDGQQPDELTYVIEDTFGRGLVKGDQVLFGVPKGDAVPDHWVVGEKAVARERAWIEASLPESRKLTC